MKDRVRILQIGMSSNIGGIETYIYRQFLYLDKSRVSYDFVQTYGDGDFPFKWEVYKNGGKVFKTPTRKDNMFKYYLFWIKFLFTNRNKYNAITINVSGFGGSFFPLLIAWMVGIPGRLVHSHNANKEVVCGVKRKTIEMINKFIMHTCVTGRIACGSMAGKALFGNKPYIVVPVCVETNKYRRNEIIRENVRKKMNIEGKFVIGNVARFNEQKNHKFLIDVFYEITKLDNRAILILIGGHDLPGDEIYYKNTVRKIYDYRISDKVLILDKCDNVSELMQAMDCFVLSSFYEGFPVVGVECQAASLPVFFSDTITKDIKIIPEVKFLPLADPATWAKDILSYRNYVWEDMSNNVIEAGYDIQTEVKKLEKLYIDMLE